MKSKQSVIFQSCQRSHPSIAKIFERLLLLLVFGGGKVARHCGIVAALHE